jgi:hypothetical protein
MAAHHADYIDDPRFNKSFELPADLAIGCLSPFKVKYADYGYRNESHPEKENVLLFYGSLLGSRLAHVAKDKIAKEHNIRIINVDRPGIGGTDAVHVKHRMNLWLGKLIPQIMLRSLNLPDFLTNSCCLRIIKTS